MQTGKRRRRILIVFLTGVVALASPGLADDKDLLKQGGSNPNVIIIVSNTYSMQYLPYTQGQPPNLPPDGQYQDSPISKFGLAKGANSSVGYAFEVIDKAHRVAVHLTPVSGGQPYGQLTVRVVKDYQTGFPAGNPTLWTTQKTVKLTYTAAISTIDAYPNLFTTGPDANLYMGFMKTGDWNLNSDCGGWFVQNSLPAVGIPRDYQNDLACSITACTQPPEVSTGCVLRYTRPMSAVIHYAPGATDDRRHGPRIAQ